MADNQSGHDPLGDRLRATLKAEHADIERRHAAQQNTTPTSKRALPWIPFAVAAAVIAIAGIFFIANRSNDQAVDLAVAEQPDDDSNVEPTTAPPIITPAAVPTDAAVPAATTVPAIPAPEPSAPNNCDSPIEPGPRFVWDIEPTDPDGGLIAHSDAGTTQPITRILVHDQVVMATGGCTLTSNGSVWLEIRNTTGTDWVNATYLQAGVDSCLVGEQYGTRTRGNENILVTVQAGDFFGGIAERHNVTVNDLLAANPQLDPSTLNVGDSIAIPTRAPAQALGPIDGIAAVQEGLVAFASDGAERYLWYPESGIIGNQTCFGSGSTGLVCLTGPVRLIDFQDPEPIWSGDGWTTAFLTGRINPGLQPRGDDFVEVSIFDGAVEYIGFVDPAESTTFTAGPCTTTGDDSLAATRCTRVPAAARPQGADTTATRTTAVGDPTSTADHIHVLRTESNDECIRVVIEFGSDANEADEAATSLPPIEVVDSLTSVRITTTDRPLESAFGDVQRVDYEAGIGLFALEPGYEFSVQLMHDEMDPHVRFQTLPARVVIDFFPRGNTPDPTQIPFGERFVLRRPIQAPGSPGIPVGTDIVVTGFGRPFEAFGLYRIWSVPDDVDADVFLAEPPEPLFEGPVRTSGWAEGWGEFAVELPALEVGSYIAVFGELPPTDEIGFYGAGQLFSIVDPNEPAPSVTPELLPDVELPPEPA